jgi:hypothetical protein
MIPTLSLGGLGRKRAMADPYYDNVVLLLDCQGADTSIHVFDTSRYARTVTCVGNAQIDTAQAKFGGSAVLLDANGDYLSVPDSTDWDCGGIDYTWEAWVRLTGAQFAAAGTILFDQFVVGNNPASSYGISLDGSSTTSRDAISFYYANSGSVYAVTASGVSLPFDAWNHIAVCKYSGNNVRIFGNGVLEEDSIMSGGTPNNGSGALTIGGRDDASFQYYMGGWIGAVRITRGVARYKNDFTPPAFPFPAF